MDRIGDIGRESTKRIAHRAAGGDPVKAAAVELKAQEVWDELAGPAPTALERLILRRVVNAWVAAHAAECALAADTTERNRLESIVSKAERRLLASVRELAVVRRLEAPAMLARLEAASADDGPRMALVEVAPTESAAVPSAD